jgi:predicted nucleic acid-binding protein
MAPSPVILDTNVLLDIFVFRDERSLPLQQMFQNQERQLIYCQAMHDEFIDVLSRSSSMAQFSQSGNADRICTIAV